MNLDDSFNSNLFLTTVIGDFNAKSKNWSEGDRSTIEVSKIEFLTSQFGLSQIIKEPTHILENSSSCIDLIFTTQPNMVLESGVHHSLHQNCHHQIIFAKFNLKVYYPPPYERTIFHYSQANVDHIQQAINLFDWENVFLNTDVNAEVFIFSNTVLNILNNYIPHETKICDDRDPPWMTTKIKEFISQKNKLYSRIKKSNNGVLSKQLLQSLQQHLSKSIENAKKKYFFRISEKLNNPKTSIKCYWSLIKTLLNGKKVPCIPPVYDNNRYVTDFKEKCQLFNSYFSEQCTLFKNISTLPNTYSKHTNNILDTIVFSKEDIYKIINNLDPNKAHGHDMISIRMIKLCGISICKPLDIIFQNCLRSGKFPSEWKKANVVPTFKKGDKQCIKNYRPVSLLPVCGKVFERLLYNKMFSFFLENDLISPKQSGFRPGDSCTNQLLSIAHEILSAFDDGHEVRGVFLDISKAFDRVWHEGLLFKLQQYGISGELITLIKDFLSCRKQRVVLNGQHSPWADVKVGVPQGSILGPLLFLIYINDLPNGLNSNVKLFADDTSLFSVFHNTTDSANLLNSDLSKINEWPLQWKMSFNPDPIKQAQEIIFSRKTSKRNHPGLTFNNNIVNLTTKHKHLGMIFDSKLSFDEHLKSALKKIRKTVGLLRKFQGILPRTSLITIYKSFARPHLDYGDIIYDQTFNESFHQRIESIQYNAAVAMAGAIRGTSSEKLYQELGLESLRSRRWLRKLCLFYKIYKNKSPS